MRAGNIIKGATYLCLAAIALKCGDYLIDHYSHEAECQRILRKSGVHPSWSNMADSERKEFVEIINEIHYDETMREGSPSKLADQIFGGMSK